MRSKLFLDFDNVIVQSTKAFCSVYNEIYRYCDEFKQADWRKVNKWNFTDQCPLVKNVEDIFADKRFFDRLDFVDKNMKNTLIQLNDIFEIIIVSIGTYFNIALKSIWTHNNLSFIKDSIFIINKGCKMDKSIVKMNEDDILVDDHQDNLFTSSAGTKICFADLGRKEWNKKWDGLIVSNSIELLELLNNE